MHECPWCRAICESDQEAADCIACNYCARWFLAMADDEDRGEDFEEDDDE